MEKSGVESLGVAGRVALGASSPRYLQLAQTLLNEIQAGRYPVGALLPTEFQLCEQFGVSRFTAREAVKRLVMMGLVVRQPRVGTTVKAQQITQGYRQSAADVSDLYRYATDTTLVIDHSETTQIDKPLAQMLEASEGETWLHLRGHRVAPGQRDPLCLTQLWIAPAFRAVQGMKGPLPGAVHAAIESQFGEVITTVEQEIRAVTIGAAEARVLHVPARSPGLWVSRRYRNRNENLVELAISTHPAERFSYSTVLRREWGVGTGVDK